MNLGDIKSIGFHVPAGLAPPELFINGELYPVDPINDRLAVLHGADGSVRVEFQKGGPVYMSMVDDPNDWSPASSKPLYQAFNDAARKLTEGGSNEST